MGFKNLQNKGAQMNTNHILTFLGTGASCGVPSYYCGCKACEEALANPKAARNCACLLISGAENTLIDASPDLRMQLVRSGAKDVARVLLTHEHFDHIGGIPQLEFYVKLQTRTPLPVYAGAKTLAAIKQQFSFMLDILELHQIEVGETLEFDDIRYTPLPAKHGEASYGYLLETPATRLAYFPDTGPLDAAVIDCMGMLDHLVIDATFNGKNWMPASHLTIDEAIGLAQHIGARKTWLTHLSMHYDTPITLAELEERLAIYNGTITPAYDNLTIEL